jgi:hypothetical protein
MAPAPRSLRPAARGTEAAAAKPATAIAHASAIGAARRVRALSAEQGVSILINR